MDIEPEAEDPLEAVRQSSRDSFGRIADDLSANLDAIAEQVEQQAREQRLLLDRSGIAFDLERHIHRSAAGPPSVPELRRDSLEWRIGEGVVPPEQTHQEQMLACTRLVEAIGSAGPLRVPGRDRIWAFPDRVEAWALAGEPWDYVHVNHSTLSDEGGYSVDDARWHNDKQWRVVTIPMHHPGFHYISTLAFPDPGHVLVATDLARVALAVGWADDDSADCHNMD